MKKDRKNNRIQSRISNPGWGVPVNGLLIGLLLSLCIVACSRTTAHHQAKSEKNNRETIKTGASLLKDGDLVLRTGRDYISFALRQFSLTDKTYSHGGIIRIEDGKAWVYHAIGGEDNPKGTLRKEPFAAFCNPNYNLGFGIFRYELNPKEKQKIDQLTDQYFKDKTPFDMKFDLQSDSALYCSEFVYKVVTQATDSNYLPTTQIGNFKYIAIDNLFVNKHASLVFQASY